jgi:uncharacterized membrane protein YfcA
MTIWLSIVAVTGLLLGAQLPDMLGFWWASLLLLIVAMIVLWEMVRWDEKQSLRQRIEQRDQR